MNKSPFPPTDQQYCGNCYYCRVAFDETTIQCRFSPPVQMTGHPKWPVVMPEDWCGAWAPVEP